MRPSSLLTALLQPAASIVDAFQSHHSLNPLPRPRSNLAAIADESASTSPTSTPPSPQDGPPFRLTHIDHIVIRCHDFSRMFDFYHRVLGCTIDEPIEEHVNRFGGALTHLRAGSCYIDLLAYDSNHLTNEGKEAASRMHAGGVGLGDTRLEDVKLSAETSTLDHLCLRVDSFDQQRMVAYLEGESVEIVGMGDRLGADGVGPSVYLRDPEGNVLELKGAPLNRDQTEVKEPTNASQEMRRSDDKSNALSLANGEGGDPLEDNDASAGVPATPCNRICRYNADWLNGQVCVGCFREAFEIAGWQSMTPAQKSFTLLDAMDRCSESSNGQSFDGAISPEELTRQQQYWAQR